MRRSVYEIIKSDPITKQEIREEIKYILDKEGLDQRYPYHVSSEVMKRIRGEMFFIVRIYL